MNIKVSVIIPVYNVENYLRLCLDSVINQTLKEIEIICINDGSTDKSLEILKEYEQKDSRIIVIDQQNQGVSSARNAGIKIARGEYIGFVDSDDWIEDNFYEALYNKGKKEDGDIVAAPYIEQYSSREHVSYISSWTVWDKIFKTKLIKENQIQFDVSLELTEDSFFYFTAKYYLKPSFWIYDTLYYYRQERDGQVTKIFTSNASKEEKEKQATKYWDIRNNFLKNFMLFLDTHKDKNKYINLCLNFFVTRLVVFHGRSDFRLGIAKGTGKPTQKQKDFFYDLSAEFKRFDYRKELIEKMKPYKFPVFEYLENKDIKSFYKFFRDDERRISACKRFEELIFGKTLEHERAIDLLSAKRVFSILRKYVPSISSAVAVNLGWGGGAEAWLKKWADEKFEGAGEYLALSSCDLPQEKLLIDKSKVKQVSGKVKFSDINRRYDLAIRISDDKKISTNIDDEITLITDLSDLIIFAGDDTSQNPQNSYLFRKKGYECFDIFRDEIWNYAFFYPQIKQNIALFAKGQRAKELIDKGLKPVDFLSSKYCETFVAESKKTALKEVEKLKKFYKKVLVGAGGVLLLVVVIILLLF